MYSAQEGTGGGAPSFPAGFGDQMTSTLLVMGVMTALYHRISSGTGQLVDCALYRAGAWGMTTQLLKSFVYPEGCVPLHDCDGVVGVCAASYQGPIVGVRICMAHNCEGSSVTEREPAT